MAKDWKAVASSAPYDLATEIEECPFGRFWVVLLASDGDQPVQVFQDEPMFDCDPPNPWLRLRRLCSDHPELRIVNMAYVQRHQGQGQINLSPNAEGYFYAKRMRQTFNAGPYTFNDECEGVGSLDDGRLTIFWVDTSDSTRCEQEVRDVSEEDKQHMLGLICR